MSKLFLIFLIAFGLQSCDQNPYGKGMTLYNKHCTDCHGKNGIGLAALIPPLADADYLRNQQDKIACIIRNGLEDPITVNGQVFDFQKMPANEKLSDKDIANIINFINKAWGNDIPSVKIEEIEQNLLRCGDSKKK